MDEGGGGGGGGGGGEGGEGRGEGGGGARARTNHMIQNGTKVEGNSVSARKLITASKTP